MTAESPMMAPPKHLSAESAEWWRDMCEMFVLDSHHLRILQLCCEAWDRAQQARRTIKREGMLYTDRFDQPKAHPAVDIERKSRDQFRLLLRELGLDVAPPGEINRAPTAPANANLKVS